MSKTKRRIRLTLRFDGKPFSGWQSQKNGSAVQDVVEAALHRMLKQKTRLIGCSRTDSGVHAEQFVAHFETQSRIPLEAFVKGLNSMLPRSIAILKAANVGTDFHARKSARKKFYRYVIFNSPIRDPFRLDRAWQIEYPLRLASMQRAAKTLQGKHDFSCFQGADPNPRQTLRTLELCRVRSKAMGTGRWEIQIDLASKGFLKYMVRNIVGTLVEVGQGRRPEQSLAGLIKSKDRRLAGATAPACGLYLMRVVY